MSESANKRYELRERKNRPIPVYIYTPGKRKQRAHTVDENPYFKSRKNLNRSLATAVVQFDQEDIANLNKSVEELLESSVQNLNDSVVLNRSETEALNDPENLTRVLNISKEGVLSQRESEQFGVFEPIHQLSDFELNSDSIVDNNLLSNQIDKLDFLIRTSTPKLNRIHFDTSFKTPILPVKSLFSEEPRFNEFREQTVLVKQLSFANNLSEFVELGNFFNMTTPFDISSFHKSVPEFDGNVDNLNRFLACCEHFHSNLGTDELRTTFLKSLVRKLVGRAFDFYFKKETWATWVELKSALKTYFSPTQSFEGFQIELCKSKQEKLSVREFGEKIEKILVEINKISNQIEVAGNNGGEFFKIQNEKLAIKSFLNGLNEPLKTILRSRKYNLVQDAIKDAIEIENDEALNKMQSINISDPKPVTKIESIQRETDSYWNKPNLGRRVICFRCKQEGHTFRNCYANINSNFQNNRLNNFQPRANFVPNSFNNRPNFNGNRNNYFSNGQRSSYFERNANQQLNGRMFVPNRNEQNRFNNNSNYVSNNERVGNQSQFGQNKQFENRNNRNFDNRNTFNRTFENPNTRSYGNSYSQNNNVRFRNDNQNMQTFSQSKNVVRQSNHLDNAALDFHMI